MIEPQPKTPLTRQGLYDLVWDRPMSVAATELGVSANGLSKVCDRLLIPYPSRGHWAKARTGRAAPRPPLPPAPEGFVDPIAISGERSRSRRPRTRFSAEQRREQLIQTAAEIIEAEGLAAATIKGVARRIGVSEAMVHNHFPQRRDLLVALARRELDAMESRRQSEISRGHDRFTRATLSTITYLREVASRGALIQILTQSAEVREALRDARAEERAADRKRTTDELETQFGLPPDIARGSTTVLSALVLRAGRLVASGKLPLEAGERLALAITSTARSDLNRAQEAAS